MNTKKPRICPISKLPLSPFAHGNKKYHTGAEQAARELNNARRYKRIKNMDNLAIRLDDILARHYPFSNGVESLRKDLLDREGFAWDFNTSVTHYDKNWVFWILDYGYSTSTNKNLIIIHYGNNPVQQPDIQTGNTGNKEEQ